MNLQIIRPDKNVSEDRKEELRKYLVEQWMRAKNSRMEQVDSDYEQWSKAYDGIPLETIRTVPFYKSSNFVVKLIRMYVDTFVARSLNIVFATRPLLVVDGMPSDLKAAWELYANRKALYEWNFYKLAKDLMLRGNKTGTVVTKSNWFYDTSMAYTVGKDSIPVEEEVIHYDSTCTRSIPFEDFYVYPLEINHLDEAIIKFQRVRYPAERAQRLIDNGVWALPEGRTLETYLKHPTDVKRQTQQDDSGVSDSQYREVATVECHLRYALGNDETKLYDIIAVLSDEGDLFDLYYNPYPRNLCTFADYRPLPREDLFYGESMCQLLGQSQEEASTIHNDRRNNSFIANSVCFKRRNGSRLPNPSTNWYPGKVWDLDDMDDLEAFQIGRNYDDMLSQEDHTFQFAGQLIGISEGMTGSARGSAGKRGVYNTMGTIAVMQEGNQRQDTNIRDVRESLSRIAATHSKLEAELGSDSDPMISLMPSKMQPLIKEAFAFLRGPGGHLVRHEIKASDAGVNKEVERANLMQMANVLGQYGQTTIQMAAQLSNPQLNPSLRLIMNDVVHMQKWLATRMAREFDEFDLEEVMPDVDAAIEASIPGGGRGTTQTAQSSDQPGMDGGSASGALPPVSRPQLQAIQSLPTLPGGTPPQ